MRIDSLNVKKITIIEWSFFISMLVIVYCLFFFPIGVNRIIEPFKSDNTGYSTRRFELEFENLVFFNRFLSIMLVFHKDSNFSDNKISIFAHTSLISSNGLQKKHQLPSYSTGVKFMNGSDYSNEIGVYNTEVVLFTKFHGSISVQLPDKTNPIGHFVIQSNDIFFVIIDIVIRVSISILSIILFARLCTSDISFQHSILSQKNLIILVLVQILGSNPLLILSIFSSNWVFRYYNFIVEIIFMSHTLFSMLILVLPKFSSKRYKWKGQYLVYMIPFLAYGLAELFENLHVYHFLLVGSTSCIDTNIKTSCIIKVSLLCLITIFFIMFSPKEDKDLPAQILGNRMVIFCIMFHILYNIHSLFVDNYRAYDIKRLFMVVFSTVSTIYINYLCWPIPQTVHNEQECSENGRPDFDISEEIDKDKN